MCVIFKVNYHHHSFPSSFNDVIKCKEQLLMEQSQHNQLLL